MTSSMQQSTFCCFWHLEFYNHKFAEKTEKTEKTDSESLEDVIDRATFQEHYRYSATN